MTKARRNASSYKRVSYLPYILLQRNFHSFPLVSHPPGRQFSTKPSAISPFNQIRSMAPNRLLNSDMPVPSPFRILRRPTATTTTPRTNYQILSLATMAVTQAQEDYKTAQSAASKSEAYAAKVQQQVRKSGGRAGKQLRARRNAAYDDYEDKKAALEQASEVLDRKVRLEEWLRETRRLVGEDGQLVVETEREKWGRMYFQLRRGSAARVLAGLLDFC